MNQISNMVEKGYVTSEEAWLNLRAAMDRAFGLFRPKAQMPISEWAKMNRVIPEGASALPGKYKGDNAPYQIGMMDEIQKPWVETVTMMTGKRIGKTIVIENIIGYNMDYNPVPQMVVLPTDKLAEHWSKIYLSKMIRYTPSLQAKVGETKSRKKGIEILLRIYPGGFLVIVGANSPSSFGTYNAMFVLFDETDKYPESSGVEGNPIELGKGRAANYPGERRFVQTSTPTISGLSVIENQFLQSNQSFYHVPCPFCGDKRVMLFSKESQFKHLTKASYLKFDEEGGQWVYLECGNCNQQISESFKRGMVTGGEWIATVPEVRNHTGFHLNALYSLLGYDWLEVVGQYLKARQSGDKNKLIPFINTVLGETFTERMKLELSEAEINARCEDYTRENIPLEVVVLTAAVDVQGLWKEAVVIGWGADEESWVIERKLFHGPYDSHDEWVRVDRWLLEPRHYVNGMEAKIVSVVVDSGAYSNYVYDFCKRKRNQLTFAGKGVYGLQRDIMKLADAKKAGFRYGVVGVDVAKTIVYRRLEIVGAPGLPKGGYMHFPKPYFNQSTNENYGCGEDYFKQLMAEEPEIKEKGGKKTIHWVKKQERNEVLDCTVYNLAALRGLFLVAKNMSMNVLAERHRKRVGLHSLDVVDVPVDEVTGSKADEVRAKKSLLRRVSKRVNRY